MQSFKVIAPIPPLIPYIKHYWVLCDDSTEPVSERTIPTGSMQLIFHRSKRLSVAGKGLQPQAFISGQSIGFNDVVSTGAIEMIAVVFRPHAANLFLKDPANYFYGLNVSTDEAEDTELSDLANRVKDAPDSDTGIDLIEQFLLGRLTKLPDHNFVRIVAALEKIDSTPEIKTKALSETTHLSEKQFCRIFTSHIGATPKEFIRIVRMQRALAILQHNPKLTLTQLACESGFYDQSHMIKEFHLLSGYTPTEYLSLCDPCSDYFS